MRNRTLETIRLVKQWVSLDFYVERILVMVKCKSFATLHYLFASQIHAQLIFSIHVQEALLLFPSAPHKTKNIRIQSAYQ